MKNNKTKRLKICHVADLNEIHCRRYIGYFIQKDFADISILNCRPLKIEGLPFDENSKKCEIFDVSSKIKIPVIRHIISFLKMRKVIAMIRPDILHVHSAGVYAFLSVLVGFRPVVVFPWGSDVLTEPKRSRILKWTTQYVVRKADLITPSSEVAANACIQLGASKDRISIIQVGIDLDKFKPDISAKELRSKLRIADSDPVIISVRDFRKNYNIEYIIKCIPYVLNRIPNAKFVFLRGPHETEEKKLKCVVEKFAIEDAVRFVGRVEHDEMPLYYNLSDLIVSVPSSDSSPNSLHEAMACGVVPIVSDIPANRYWIKDGSNGAVVPLYSPEIIADKIIALLNDKIKREDCSRINLQIVKEKLDIKSKDPVSLADALVSILCDR